MYLSRGVCYNHWHRNAPAQVRLPRAWPQRGNAVTTPILNPIPDGFKCCSRCGESRPFGEFHADKTHNDGLSSKCKTCQSEYYQEWRSRNAESLRAAKAKYHADHIEEENARSKKWHENNREYAISRQRKYRLANIDKVREKDRVRSREDRRTNPEKCREKVRRSMAAHPDRVRQSRAAYLRANPDIHRVYNQRRRARKLLAGGRWTSSDIEAIRVAQGNRCYLCGRSLKHGYHIDHFIPLALGGTNEPGNLRLACPHCNLTKSAKHPFELGRLL